MQNNQIKEIVKDKYGRIAAQSSACCAGDSGCGQSPSADKTSRNLGYSEGDLQSVPQGANLGLGCGNPIALASLTSGETVLDLGSGAGFDCFLAARRVGPEGKVIGIDMIPEMLVKARENAVKGGYKNVDFRPGEIERLPVADESVDVIISNCVINLSPHKDQVFREAFRVLKPGGRLMVSDIVLLEELPDGLKSSAEAYVGCVAGASLKQEYLKLLEQAGFQNIQVQDQTVFFKDYLPDDPVLKHVIAAVGMPEDQLKQVAETVVSVKISAIKSELNPL